MSGELDELITRYPLDAVVQLVGRTERTLDPEQVREAVLEVASRRVDWHRIAIELRDNPGVLQTGCGPSQLKVGNMLAALKKAGAEQVAWPRCCDCGREIAKLMSRRGGLWACSTCTRPMIACAGCGGTHRLAGRDRHGQPICRQCRGKVPDPTPELVELVVTQHPTASPELVRSAMQLCSPLPGVRQRMAWAVLDRPDLLTGAGADAPVPTVLTFIDALATAGVATVVRPACPGCGKVRSLPELRDGQRICSWCHQNARRGECGRCGRPGRLNYRDDAGVLVCDRCRYADPISRDKCIRCHRW